MNNIDVMKLAEELEIAIGEKTRSEIENFIESINGQSFSTSEVISKVIGPLIGITGQANRIFTIELLQKVVDELSSSNEES
ncbi:hypothetical protein [Metabacillus litoralis]|uniref:hypothetical protein n=1 Tax=Metabacillus litoralis TaxID=152268 RepID=UPI0020412391|nr:hypothetical protein [Metabacillus litoralis]MCM3411259.1 hypothetical protein [Metabacillus litoralis]